MERVFWRGLGAGFRAINSPCEFAASDFTTLGSVLTQQRLLRKNRAWCPDCFMEWQAAEQPIYEPLLWNVSTTSVMFVINKLWLNNALTRIAMQPCLCLHRFSLPDIVQDVQVAWRYYRSI